MAAPWRGLKRNGGKKRNGVRRKSLKVTNMRETCDWVKGKVTKTLTSYMARTF